MPDRRTVALLFLTVGLLALSACGGENAEETSATVVPASEADPATTMSSALPGRPGLGGTGAGSVSAATHADLVYANESPAQVLDLWLPPDTTRATPLVVYVHGGAFKGGDKNMVGAKVQPLLDAGYAVASVNYRLSPEATFPAGAQDVKAAVRWLRANAGTYNLDADRFAAWGESAGGTLVSLLGTTGDQATVLDDPALGNVGVSSAVQAVVHWYGPTDFLQMDSMSASGGGCTSPEQHDPASSPESLWMGAAIQTVPQTVAAGQPHHLRGDSVGVASLLDCPWGCRLQRALPAVGHPG